MLLQISKKGEDEGAQNQGWIVNLSVPTPYLKILVGNKTLLDSGNRFHRPYLTKLNIPKQLLGKMYNLTPNDTRKGKTTTITITNFDWSKKKQPNLNDINKNVYYTIK